MSPQLTDREYAVLHGISYGRTNGQIGREMGLSEDTVKNYVRTMFTKLGVELGILAGGALALQAHPDAVPGQRIPAGWLRQPTPRNPAYRDQHIATCFAAEACPCRQPRSENQQ